MAAGFQPTLTTVNNQAANLVIGLRNTLISIQEFQTWLNSVGAAGLEALGMTTGDAATMVSAFNDLNDMATIYNGGISIHLSGTYQYTQFAKQLTAYN